MSVQNVVVDAASQAKQYKRSSSVNIRYLILCCGVILTPLFQLHIHGIGVKKDVGCLAFTLRTHGGAELDLFWRPIK